MDQLVCLSWVEGAMEAEALALWPPTTSPFSPSPVGTVWREQTDGSDIIYTVGADAVLTRVSYCRKDERELFILLMC